ncbi:MAG: sulfatase-like hydrolase/transferase [Bacteroidota bacterium]
MLVISEADAQQNMILIIADDLSPDYLGCFSTTTDTAKTPNICALAQSGIKFTNVWAAPVCSPTRAGILTGRYPFRTGVGGAVTGITSPQIDTAEMSIAKVLKYYAPQTYNTACIGKWHLTMNTPTKRLNPNKLGFDLYSGNFNGAITNYYNYQRVKNGILDTVTTYATTQTVNDAIDWMDTMSKSKPFFLWLAFNAPHTPFHLPPPSLCDTTGLSGITADITAYPEKYFKASLQAMDAEIGRLFAYLILNNLMDSTNIIFIGDNGNQPQVAQIANPSKSKGTIYDYGVRVPMLIKGPCVVNGYRASNALINTPDLFATIAEMCGFQNWKNSIPASTIVDSRTFLPTIKNETSTNRTWIFTETFNTPATTDDGKTIRNDNYHLLRFDNGNEEFYNQTIDVEENNNLLLNTSSMTSTDIANYHFLCDSLSTLTGTTGCIPLSVEDLSLEVGKHVFPNPSNTSINVDCNNGYQILSVTGLLIKQSTLPTTAIQISELASGLYFLKSGSEITRFIKAE